MEKKMEATVVYWGYLEIMGKKMRTDKYIGNGGMDPPSM